MVRHWIALICIALASIAACGGDGERVVTIEPAPSAATQHEWTKRYMQLSEARQFVSELGLEGVSLQPAAYGCIQMTCPSAAPGDDSWGCLSILPTGDPDNAESLFPDDPAGWYSVDWQGAFGETYAARPEPVVNEPRTVLEAGQDVACGAGFGHEMTAAEAVQLLTNLGMAGGWQPQNPPLPTCPPGAECPIHGIPAETVGCVGLSIFDLPQRTAGQTDPSVTVYGSWSSAGDSLQPDGVHLSYSVLRPLSAVEAAFAAAGEGACVQPIRPTPNAYDWVPHTTVIQPTYWSVSEQPGGSTLMLHVAAGGGCEEFERLDVQETDEAVTINAYIRHTTPGPDSGCTDELNVHTATVELKKPLGDRTLLGCAPTEIWYVEHDVDCREPGSI